MENVDVYLLCGINFGILDGRTPSDEEPREVQCYWVLIYLSSRQQFTFHIDEIYGTV